MDGHVKFQPPARIIDSIVVVPGANNDPQDRGRRHGQPKHFRPSRRPKPAYPETITMRAALANENMSKNRSPYRFAVRRRSSTLDILLLDSGDNVVKALNVTPDNYGDMLDKMSSGKGLIFDD